ncbi:tyrosine-type recombinase/integrase [Serratia quinivorans]|uniref:tyrosine-type recombinase/integrase n=1 Tax=Serratia quinivorans TaxID=137545 RepID=UPI0021BD0FD2|nr:tyrosine-type recombinase/integrase [Serratia quinivorans]
MQRYDHLSSTLKAFMLDKPDATREELKEHLKVMAEQFLTDNDARGYWNMVEPDSDGIMVSLVEDTMSSLKEIAATQHLSIDQHRHLVEALSLMDDVKSKARGEAQGLLSRVETQGEAVTARSSNGELTMINNHPSSKPGLEVETGRCTMSVESLASIYLSEHAVNLSASTLRVVQSAHKTLHEASVAVGCIDMANHSRSDLVALREYLAQTRSNSTVNALLAKLITLLGWAKLNDHINNDYSAKLKYSKDIDSKRKAFSDEQVVNLLNGSKGTPIEALVSIAAITGARLGELMQLEVSDLKVMDGITFIDINDNGTGKTLKNKYSKRVVPLVDGALGFDLQAFMDGLPLDGGKVFSISLGVASHHFRNLRERVGADAEGLTFHSLRHSMAGRLKAADTALTTAQAILGHSSNSITYDHYGKGASAELVKMHDAIKESFNK